MNVKELIEVLGEYPEEMRVVVQGYEDGYDDVAKSSLKQIHVKLGAGKERWEGDHIEIGSKQDTAVNGDDIEQVVAIDRTSW